MNLISDSDRLTYRQAMEDVHDTFKRSLHYLAANNILTISSDANFNYAYGNEQFGTTTTTQIVSGAFYARVHYPDPVQLKNEKTFPISEIPIAGEKIVVRLKVDTTGLALINGAEQIYLDNKRFEKFSATRPHGLFSPDYYTLYFVELK